MTAPIDRVWPDPAENLSDDDLVAGLGAGVRVNFVSSIDGAATHNGLSGGLSGPADKRHFELLRRVCDVVLVGAGTVRAEGYGSIRVSDASVRWRRAHGMPDHPVFAIVSAHGYTPGFEAEVYGSPAEALSSLRERGLTRILCEGGPTLFRTLLEADAVDELCITIAPSLEGGDAPRITRGDTPPRGMRLEHVLRSGDTLLLRYARAF
jgi:riboflavin biosynthesis pyrimidine reductase